MLDIILTTSPHSQEMFKMISTTGEINILAKIPLISNKMHSRLGPRVPRSGKIKGIPGNISLRDRVLTGLIRDPQKMIFTETDLQTSVTPFLTETSGSEESRVPTDLSRTSMMSGL